MKMVILGAGASYDSIIPADNSYNLHRSNWQPPMGTGLFGFHKEFDEILKKYPGAESIRSEMSAGPDIEELFQDKYDLIGKPNGAGMLYQINNVQFYLQDLFFNISNEYVGFGTSNYDLLVTKAYNYYMKTDNEVVFVNFNYDTLLERSIENICKIKFSSAEDYIKYGLKVIKPHGSCNWFRRVNLGGDANWPSIKRQGYSNFFYGLPFDILNTLISSSDSHFQISPVPLSNIESDSSRRFLLLPEIIIPLKTKDGFVLPDKHLKYLEKSLKSIDEILVIGWKANEQHFNDILKENIGSQPLRLITVCGNESRLISTKLSNLINVVEPIVFEQTGEFNGKRLNAGTFSAFNNNHFKIPAFDFFQTKK